MFGVMPILLQAASVATGLSACNDLNHVDSYWCKRVKNW